MLTWLYITPYFIFNHSQSPFKASNNIVLNVQKVKELIVGM